MQMLAVTVSKAAKFAACEGARHLLLSVAGRALTVGVGVAHLEIGLCLLSPAQGLVPLGAQSRVSARGSHR